MSILWEVFPSVLFFTIVVIRESGLTIIELELEPEHPDFASYKRLSSADTQNISTTSLQNVGRDHLCLLYTSDAADE